MEVERTGHGQDGDHGQQQPADEAVAALAVMLAGHVRQEASGEVELRAAKPERGLHAGDLGNCAAAWSFCFFFLFFRGLLYSFAAAAAIVGLRSLVIPSLFFFFFIFLFTMPFGFQQGYLPQLGFDHGRVVRHVDHNPVADIVDADMFVFECGVGQAGQCEAKVGGDLHLWHKTLAAGDGAAGARGVGRARDRCRGYC